MDRSLACLLLLCASLVTLAPSASAGCPTSQGGYFLYCDTPYTSTGVLGSDNQLVTTCDSLDGSVGCYTFWQHRPGSGYVCYMIYPGHTEPRCVYRN